MRAVLAWDVYLVDRGNSHTKKFFIALYAEQAQEYGRGVTYWFGFYINTGEQRPDGLQGSDVIISAHVYPFLSYDSWINAGAIVRHDEAQLVNRRDYIRRGDKARVLEVVAKSRTLEPAHIKAILAANEASIKT